MFDDDGQFSGADVTEPQLRKLLFCEPLNRVLHEGSDETEIKNTIKSLEAEVKRFTSGTCTLLHLSFYSHVRLLDRLQWLVREGYDINLNDKATHKSPLHFSLTENCEEKVIDFLIAHGANVNAKDNSGDTPLHIAVRKCKYVEDGGTEFLRLRKNVHKVVELLIAHDCEVNAMNHKGETALHTAAMFECPNMDLIQLLISNGCDMQALMEGETACDLIAARLAKCTKSHFSFRDPTTMNVLTQILILFLQSGYSAASQLRLRCSVCPEHRFRVQIAALHTCMKNNFHDPQLE